jgi:DNA-binding transcriptional LysR family regulator
MRTNLRHLRVFLAVAEHGSITRAAELGLVSQPAVTQAIAKLATATGSRPAPSQPAAPWAS